jgi:hypothetical protein
MATIAASDPTRESATSCRVPSAIPPSVDGEGRKYILLDVSEPTEFAVRVRRRDGRIVFPDPDEELVLTDTRTGEVCTATVHEYADVRTATAFVRFCYPPSPVPIKDE